jgi:hypothetical protein
MGKAVSSNSAHGKVYLIQQYVIKFVGDLRQVGRFLRVLWFPPSIKLTLPHLQLLQNHFMPSHQTYHIYNFYRTTSCLATKLTTIVPQVILKKCCIFLKHIDILEVVNVVSLVARHEVIL